MSLDRLLRPRSVAVLGASARPGALSGRFLSGLARHGFNGRVVPVNPRRDEVAGLPCAASIAEAGAIDLAVISLPKESVLGALEECAAAGVAGAVVFTSGYAEVGATGAERERELTALAERTGLRVLGPNSPGFINVVDRTCVIASGVGFRSELVAGGIAVVSQSGGAAGLLVERLQDAGAGMSLALCTGNEADVNAGEALSWLACHEPTRVVALFLEGLRDVDALVAGLDALRAAGKPVVALKAGATAAAARATAAHTGALATDDVVVDAFLARHRVVRAYGFDELIDCAVALERLGPAAGARVGILTTSGGAGVVATEAAERAGLALPPLSAATHARLRAVVPDFAALANPADMSGMFSEDPAIFSASLRAFTDAPEFDTAVLVLTVHPPEPSERLAEMILAAAARALAVLWTAGAMSAPARRRLMLGGIAVFEDAERCKRALRARAIPGSADAEPLPALEPPDLPGASTERDALAALAGAGVPTAPAVLCATPEAAASAARGPSAVKASAPDLPHKSDAGAVVLGVSGQAAADAHRQVVAAARAVGAHPEGSIVQPMAPDGLELIVGARRDAELGTVLVVGPGGLAAELAPRLSRRLLPLHAGEARTMLDELGLDPLFAGFRGQPPLAVDAAAQAIEAFAAFAHAIADRLEAVEINPLVVHESGATAVDALLLTSSSS
jgi:acyl-CoA synthetase (NDP forming)